MGGEIVGNLDTSRTPFHFCFNLMHVNHTSLFFLYNMLLKIQFSPENDILFKISPKLHRSLESLYTTHTTKLHTCWETTCMC